jgi:hypothetical protein
LVVCIDFLDTVTKWYYLPISEERLNLAKNEVIQLYDLYKQPEKGYLWEVLEGINNDTSDCSPMSSISACTIDGY